MKKLITTFLILTLLLTNSVAVLADTPFPDVNGDEWYYEDLMTLYNKGIIAGTGTGEFVSGGLLTKDALIKTLIVASGFNLENAPNYWAQNFIDKADQLGWLTGFEEADFTKSINRYDSCLLIVNAMGDGYTYPEDLQSYATNIADFDQVPESYKEVVLKVYALGIITGYPDGTFSGDNTLRRSEMTAILSRYLNKKSTVEPLDETSKSKLETLSSENSNVFNDLNMSVDDQQILYTLPGGGSVPIGQTGLDANIARLSEDIYIQVADYLYGRSEFELDTSFNGTYYYMIMTSDETDAYISFISEVGSNKVEIGLPDLMNPELEQLSDSVDIVFDTMLGLIDSENKAEIKAFIESYYIVLEYPEDYIRQEKFGSMTVKIVADQRSFDVQFWLND